VALCVFLAVLLGDPTFGGAILLNPVQVASKSSMKLLKITFSYSTFFFISHFIQVTTRLLVHISFFYSSYHKFSIMLALFLLFPFSFFQSLSVLSRCVLCLVIFVGRTLYSCSITPLIVFCALYHTTLHANHLSIYFLFLYFSSFSTFFPFSSFSNFFFLFLL
jgi:hypothetical protein